MTREDLIAVETGRQIINKYSTRSTFGRCVSLQESGWDPIKQRSVIGLYNTGLMLEDATDKNAQAIFIKDCASFLNTMNEAFKIKGYHIAMTEDLAGSFYVGKDKNDKFAAVNSSKDEYNSMEEAAYRHYLLNKAQYQQDMRRNIQEALIITDNSLTPSQKQSKLYAFTEGVGDSLSDAWEKFKAFINKIWLKFTEFLTRNLNTDKTYLEKYKEIILRRRYQVTGLSIDDNYQVGVVRLRQYSMMTPSIGDIENYPDEVNDDNLNIVRKKVFPAYEKGTDFNDYCKTYFLGGTGKTMELTDGLNMQELYDYCYNFKKTLNVLEKNRGEMMKCINTFEQALKDAKAAGGTAAVQGAKTYTVNNGYVSDGNEKYPITNNNDKTTASNPNVDQTTLQGIFNRAKTAATPKPTGTGGGENQPPAGAAQPPTETISYDDTTLKIGNDSQKIKLEKKRELNDLVLKYNNKALDAAQRNEALQNLKSIMKDKSYHESVYITHMGRILAEAVSGTAGGTTVSYSGTGTQKSAVVDTTSNQMAQYGTKQADTTNLVGQKLDNVSEEKLRNKFHLFENASSSVFAAMLTAAQTIMKDYMTIIHKHVESYIGKEDESEGKIPAGTVTNKDISTKMPEKIFDYPEQAKEVADKLEELNKEPEANKAEIARILNDYTQKTLVDIGGGNKAPARVFTSAEDLIEFARSKAPKQETT